MSNFKKEEDVIQFWNNCPIQFQNIICAISMTGYYKKRLYLNSFRVRWLCKLYPNILASFAVHFERAKCKNLTAGKALIFLPVKAAESLKHSVLF